MGSVTAEMLGGPEGRGELCGAFCGDAGLLTDTDLLGTEAAAGAYGAEVVTPCTWRETEVDEDDVPDNTPTTAAAAAAVTTAEAAMRRRR